MNALPSALRERRLRALDIAPLRLRVCDSGEPDHAATAVADADAPAAQVPAGSAPVRIVRLALHPDPAELCDPAIHKMYTALTQAVGKAGLQPVRVCDVADDPAAALMVFGAAQLPEGVPALRVLRVDPLAVLHADRERKRLLWEQMQALARGGSD